MFSLQELRNQQGSKLVENSSGKIPVYLDGHATTPLAPEAAAAMSPWWSEQAANPHSPHGRGAAAAAAVDRSRVEVAALLGCDRQEITFTSGATEANNIALLGIAAAAVAAGDPRRRIAVSAVEHKSILEAARALSARGFEITILPVDRNAVVDVAQLSALITTDTLLVSVMAANNEVGVIQPLDEVLAQARRVGAVAHTDAAQAVGKVGLAYAEFDLVSVSAHKLYGPMGVGALMVSAATAIRPRALMHGGGQEGGLRPGTLPTPLLVGFGVACRVARERLASDQAHGAALARRLLDQLVVRQVAPTVNAINAPRIPGSLSLTFPGLDASSIITSLANDVCLSDGSACSSGQITPSHVLSSMSMSANEIAGTLRLFCSRYTTDAEIDYATEKLVTAVAAARASHWTAHPAAE